MYCAGQLVMLAAAVFIACYLPARRASLVDPIEVVASGITSTNRFACCSNVKE